MSENMVFVLGAVCGAAIVCRLMLALKAFGMWS